jgi:hypothetical protein
VVLGLNPGPCTYYIGTLHFSYPTSPVARFLKNSLYLLEIDTEKFTGKMMSGICFKIMGGNPFVFHKYWLIFQGIV